MPNLENGKAPGDQNIYQLIGDSAFVAMVEPALGKSFLRALYPFCKAKSG